VKLWLVRHAQPLVAPGVCYGALDLSADADATRLAAQALAQALPHGAALTSSPLQRCEQLTQCLRRLRPDLTHEVDARLAEMDFGQWEGQCWDAIARAELDAWADQFATWRCGGAESVQGFMDRVGQAWDGACTQARERGATQVWITHAGVIRAVQLLATGQRQITRADQWPQAAPGFGQWCVRAL
jgi:alpha-ribazole phosphatase